MASYSSSLLHFWFSSSLSPCLPINDVDDKRQLLQILLCVPSHFHVSTLGMARQMRLCGNHCHSPHFILPSFLQYGSEAQQASGEAFYGDRGKAEATYVSRMPFLSLLYLSFSTLISPCSNLNVSFPFLVPATSPWLPGFCLSPFLSKWNAIISGSPHLLYFLLISSE